MNVRIFLLEPTSLKASLLVLFDSPVNSSIGTDLGRKKRAKLLFPQPRPQALPPTPKERL